MSSTRSAIRSARGAVLADPADPGYRLAMEYASVTGRLFCDRPSDVPVVCRDHWTSVTLMGTLPFVAARHPVHLLEDTSSDRAVPLGIMTALDRNELEKLIQRSLAPPPQSVDGGWILGSRSLLDGVSTRASAIPVDDACASEVQSEISKAAAFGVIVGHGREDVAYFPSLAICGQNHLRADPHPCSPAGCPYPQPKILSSRIATRVAIILSCAAGNLSFGVLPPCCRLGVSMLGAGAVAVIAPVGFFTLTSGLVRHVMRAIEAGLTSGEVALEANRWQRDGLDENLDCIVWGDPEISVDLCRSTERRHPLPATLPMEQEESPGDLERLKRMYGSLSTLSALDLETPGVFSLRQLLEKQERTFARVLRLSVTDSAWRERWDVLWREITQSLTTVQHEIIENLVSLSLDDYFWLANRAQLFKPVARSSQPCALCGQPSWSEIHESPLRLRPRRLRVTCSRCGVVKDAPDVESGVSIVDVRIGDGVVLELEWSGSPPVCGEIAASLNNGRSFLREARVARMSGGEFTLPARLDGDVPVAISLAFEGAPAGVHYAKVFVLDDLDLTVASCPVPLFDGDE